MLNTLMLVGRLTKDVEVKTYESGKELSRVTLAVNRSYKNEDGIYETDFIDCVLWDGLAKNIGEYCKKGDLVGVRGRLETSIYEKDNIKHKVLEVIVEKLSFISSKKSEIKEAD